MLETRNLYKKYKPKKGVPVTAIDNVSLKFPDKGMIFLLGKSGSGKSTLLNLLGGLDRYDSGEIIIKGVSSKDFDQQHFDSYRNTYVGFIFQEYNVLDEFTVGANIALAIELQGRKAENDEINRILAEVDLEGYGGRRPNELSGGQKQRVAIARALVKNPDIIMADEPTGALDSNTGRQIFDTLKKLSENKLVIVVSHDREFAEQYADRIIELADGHVVEDVTLEPGDPEKAGLEFSDRTITIPGDYELTEDDRAAINRYIRSLSSGKTELAVSRAGKNFHPTDQNAISSKTDDTFKLIKSRLPMKNAFKIGASGLKYKKIKLVFTVFLSVVAFTLFGLADTFGAYDNVRACTESIMDTGVKYASFVKNTKVTYGDGEDDFYYRSGRMSAADIGEIEENTGIHVKGVYVPAMMSFNLDGSYDASVTLSDEYPIYSTALDGFAELTERDISEMGYTLAAGRLPSGDADEIALSSYVALTYMKAGFAVYGDDGTVSYDSIGSEKELVGRKLSFGGREYTITGIVDTKLDFDRYSGLAVRDEHITTAQLVIRYALYNEFSYESGYSFCNTAIVGDGFIDRYISANSVFKNIDNGHISIFSPEESDQYYFASPEYIARMSDIGETAVRWLDGVRRTELAENEIVLSADLYEEISDTVNMEVYMYESGATENYNGRKIVGVIENDAVNNAIVCCDSMFRRLVTSSDGIFTFAAGAMPSSRGDVLKTVGYAYSDTDVRYELQNAVTYELNMVNDVLKVLADVFLYIGIGFAVFAAIMLANFIATSISYKRQEIGILRAIGSRSNDVFRIFFSESFIIAVIDFVLASAVTGGAVALINYMIRKNCGILITVLNFGVRQIVLLLAVSVIVAATASFIPVHKIASKRPIDAIRGR